jgi:hypothetical protein
MSIKASARVLSLLILVAGFPGCTWVELTAEGDKVRVLSDREVRRCKSIGRVTSTTVAKFGLIARPEASVEEELARLARNHAAGMEGDTIVPLGPVKRGVRNFGVYRCVPP